MVSPNEQGSKMACVFPINCVVSDAKSLPVISHNYPNPPFSSILFVRIWFDSVKLANRYLWVPLGMASLPIMSGNTRGWSGGSGFRERGREGKGVRECRQPRTLEECAWGAFEIASVCVLKRSCRAVRAWPSIIPPHWSCEQLQWKS